MKNKEQYIGLTKGVLTVTKVTDEKDNNKNTLVECVCSRCGALSIVRLDRLTIKAKYADKYCSKCRDTYKLEQLKKRVLGKTNGVLTCISIEGYKYDSVSKSDRAFVRCICSNCNSESVVRAERITSKTQIPKSCTNCYGKVIGSINHDRYYRQSEADSEYQYRTNQKLSACLSKFKHGAYQRSLLWDLTDERAVELLKSACYYCGSEPSFGIDRIDSSKGYVADNVVSCCGMCNIMKNKFPQESFLMQLRRICNHLHLEGSTTIPQGSTPQANGGGNGGHPEKDGDIV